MAWVKPEGSPRRTIVLTNNPFNFKNFSEKSKQSLIFESFIKRRKTDRIGLVEFAGEAFTQTPLTIDHNVLLSQLDKVKSGVIEDGTALGDGLATAINRIKDSKATSKVIILLTDGVNNQGSVDPKSAAEIATLYGIRLYTIGLGTRGMAPYPFRTPFGGIQYQNVPVEIDEELLTEMAHSTNGGEYFRATNKKSLENIFEEIDKMDTWEGAQLNTAKEILAFELTKLVHGEEEAAKAQAAAKAIFSGAADLDNMPSTALADADFTDGSIDILDILMKAEITKSRGEGRRLVQQGGVSIDGEKITDFNYAITSDVFKDGEFIDFLRDDAADAIREEIPYSTFEKNTKGYEIRSGSVWRIDGETQTCIVNRPARTGIYQNNMDKLITIFGFAAFALVYWYFQRKRT